MEARSEIEDGAYARLEVLMGGFGLLITVLLLGFGIVTYRTATNAARAELADIKDKVQGIHDEAAAAKERVVEAAELARSAAEGAQAHQQTAEQASEKVREVVTLAERLGPASFKGGKIDLSAAERQTVSEAAQTVSDKQEREWTADEFRVKIVEANSEQKWSETLRLARGMQFLHENDGEALAYALSEQGWALTELERFDEALTIYTDLDMRLADSDSSSIRRLVAMGLTNKAIVLGDLHRSDEAVAVADNMLARFGGLDDEELQLSIAKAMVTKGYSFYNLGRSDDAIKSYDDVVARFGSSNDAGLLTEVAIALVNKGLELSTRHDPTGAIESFDAAITRFWESEDVEHRNQAARAFFQKAVVIDEVTGSNAAIAVLDEALDRFRTDNEETIGAWLAEILFLKAGLLARQQKIKASIKSLQEWRTKRGNFDCQAVAEERAFDSIRSRPTFSKFLLQHGCEA